MSIQNRLGLGWNFSFVDGADVTKEAISDGYPKQKKPHLVVRCLAYVPSSDLGIE
jgi:hypothetical protein